MLQVSEGDGLSARPAERAVSAFVGAVGGGLFGGIAVALRAADEWSQLAKELVPGAVFLSLVVLAIAVAGMGGSPLLGALSTTAVFFGIGVSWSQRYRDGSQIGLNLLMAIAMGVVFAVAIVVARRREGRRSANR